MDLFYETHSTSTDNERGVASGHLDPPLSDAGRAQAAALGLRYADKEIRTVYTSDLTRAISTAEIAFTRHESRLVADPRLRECDYGTWSGYPSEQVQKASARFIDCPFPGGESLRDVVRRIEQFLDGLDRDERAVLIIAHRVTWYAFEHLLTGRELTEIATAPWKWQPGWKYHL